MKAVSTTVLGCILLALSAAPTGAAADLSWGGQIRLRGQIDKLSFDKNTGSSSFDEMRTRLNFEALVDSNVHAFVQLQDSRLWGGSNASGERLSGTTNDGKNVDLHQGYIRIDNIFGRGWGGQGGRFEFSRGNQRVFGAVGWSNVGRSFDGSMLWYDCDRVNVTAFAMALREQKLPDDADDFHMVGLYSTIKKVNLDLFSFYERDNRHSGWPTDKVDLERINFGTYYRRQLQKLDFEMNAVYQAGRKTDPTYVRTERLSIEAFMFTFEAGLAFGNDLHGRVAAGIDYSSGDDNSTDGTYHTYENSYYTGHKFRGHMDYFIGSNTAGLIDLVLHGRLDPIRGWTCRADVHYFATAKPYVSAIDSSESRALGAEVDLAVQTRRIRGMQFEAGLSMFVPDKAGTAIIRPTAGLQLNPDPGYWAYSIATVSF